MGPLAYFSPLPLGLALTLLMHQSAAALLPARFPAWAHWPGVIALGLAAGGVLQLMMCGLQGIFAQVVPAPRGRSIRGRAAVGIGSLFLSCVALAIVAGMLAGQGLKTPPLILAILAGLAMAGAILMYLWCWPTALRDFDKDRPPTADEMEG